MAQRFKREILPATEDRPQIELVRSARRTRTISMQRDGEDAHGNPACSFPPQARAKRLTSISPACCRAFSVVPPAVSVPRN